MRRASLTFALLVFAAIFGSLVGSHYFGGGAVKDSKETALTALLASADKTLRLDSRTKETGCKSEGSLPDHACTPGAVFPETTPEKICVSGYTQTVRNVPVSLKRKIYAEYGISYPQPTGSYEADHLIPLELGGNNDISNLFPESAAPAPGFHEKDLVENFLHNEVCAGRADLAAAQEQIAGNWVLVWNILTPEQIQYLKRQFN